jgi:hypothetical protein
VQVTITDQTLEIYPGDCLLYFNPNSVAHFLIALKTWHRIGHVECYLGECNSIGARPHTGVYRYKTERRNLTGVLRPSRPVDLRESVQWCERSAIGQGYDWLGLVRFAWKAQVLPEVWAESLQFCSEFATRFYRRGGLDLFPREDADAVAPFQFAVHPLLDPVTPTSEPQPWQHL